MKNNDAYRNEKTAGNMEERGLDLLLQVKNLRTSFYTEDGVVPAVRGISFDVRKGEALGIVGESGCGKSATSLSIMRLIGPPGKVEADTMLFDNREILALKDKEIRRIRGNEIAMIFQEPMTSLNPVLTIGYQLQEAIRLHQGLSKKKARAKSIEMLKMVGIPRADTVVSEFPHSLSGGMKQRVMIAMALSCEPKLIIADEPSTALDVTIQAQILELIKELRERLNTAIIFISHDLGVISEMTERVVVMYSGIIVESCDVQSLYENPSHPYTVGLLNSIPDVEDDEKKLTPIPGVVPNPRNQPQGCPYHPRCNRVMDICKKETPEIIAITENGDPSAIDGDATGSHRVRCWLFEQQSKAGR